MIDVFIAFVIGTLMGYLSRPKDIDIQEQQEIYDRQIKAHEETIRYYKELCQWHVEQRKNRE